MNGRGEEAEHAFWQVLSCMRDFLGLSEPSASPQEGKDTVLDAMLGFENPPKTSAAALVQRDFECQGRPRLRPQALPTLSAPRHHQSYTSTFCTAEEILQRAE